jgi:signal transduction histidine kinase/tetratricopeptide (TPR) repeat protein
MNCLRPGDAYNEAQSLKDIGLIYHLRGEHQQAVETINRAMDIYGRLNSRRGEMKCLHYLAVVYPELRQFQEALTCADLALKMAKEMNEPHYQAMVLDTIGGVYLSMADGATALVYFPDSLAVTVAHNFRYLQVVVLINMGKAYRLQQDFERSLSHLQHALAISTDIGVETHTHECYRLLAEIFEQLGDFKQALDFHKRFYALKSRLFDEEVENRLENLQVIHQTETAKKEAELQRIKTVELEKEIAERKRAEVSAQHRADELASLAEIAQEVSATLDLDTVLGQIATRAKGLLQAASVAISLYQPDTGHFKTRVALGYLAEELKVCQICAETGALGDIINYRRAEIVNKVSEDQRAAPLPLARLKEQGIESMMGAPLIYGDRVIGVMSLWRTREAGPFTQSNLNFLVGLTSHAAIAIENAHLFAQEQRQRKIAESLREISIILNSSVGRKSVLTQILVELRRVISHDGAAIFLPDGDDLVLSAGYEVPPEVIGVRIPLSSQNPTARAFNSRKQLIVPKVLEDPGWAVWPGDPTIRSWMGTPVFAGGNIIGIITADSFQENTYTPAEGQVLQLFANQAAIAITNQRLLEAEEEQRRISEQALAELRATQQQLIHREKMASLGELTAGIAHEIKNPLNFVNNFAAMSIELAHDLQAALNGLNLPPDQKTDLDDIMDALIFNADQINEAGRRANQIISGMLLHSRGKIGERQEVDLNRLVTEAINLTYHSMRAKSSDFTLKIDTEFDGALEAFTVVPQDLSRALVNIISNACDATNQKWRIADNRYQPQLIIRTRQESGFALISIKDNGIGLTTEAREKIFQPFFTTKPAGEGTGLGLSIVYDIITGGHQGLVEVNSEPDEFTEFIIKLPQPVTKQLSLCGLSGVEK